MLDVTALGELLIDFTCIGADKDGYPTMEAHPGGAPANFLAALSRFGAKTALLGKVGNDTFGKLLVGTLEKAGIGTRGIVMAEDVFTTLAFVTLDRTGNREFAFSRKPGADTRITFEELDLSLIDEAKVFHFGTLSLTDEPARETTYRAVAYAKSRGKLITYDPNLRKPLWRDLQEAKKQLLWGLERRMARPIFWRNMASSWCSSPAEPTAASSETGMHQAMCPAFRASGRRIPRERGTSSAAAPSGSCCRREKPRRNWRKESCGRS